MVAYIPERVLAAIEYAPGHYEPLGIEHVELPQKALAVPQFIIANGADKICGTARPYLYFEKYRKLGAPLTFMIQNRVPHCCVMNIVPIVLLWLDDVIATRNFPGNSSPLNKDTWLASLQVEAGDVSDERHTPVWNATSATIWSGDKPQRDDNPRITLAKVDAAHVPATGTLQNSWLPSERFVKAWLAFENQPTHPITPLE